MKASSVLPSNATEFEGESSSPRRGGPKLVAGLGLTVVLLVALVGVLAFGLTRLVQPASSPPRAGATPATQTARPGAGAGTAADAPTTQAVQEVIRKVDEAQAQAIASGDQNVMQPTATPDFYRQQVTTNQDLVAGGVAEVKLLNLEWGDITVDGSSVTATVYETWQTVFLDGSTQQSRDLNVYTLVKDPSRGWIVQSDDHPNQPASAVQPTPSQPTH